MSIEITFDNPLDYNFETGIEVVDSKIRLIDPNTTDQLAAYWPVFIEDDQYVSTIDIDQSYPDTIEGIPLHVFDHEPTFEEIHNINFSHTLGDLWVVLVELGIGNWYVSILLGGEIEIIKFPPEDPVCYWNFNSNATESNNKGYDGIVTGATLQPGVLDNCYYFDGNDQINMQNFAAYNISLDMSICMWLKPTSFGGRYNPWNKAYGGEGTITQEVNGTLNYFYGTSGSNTSPYQGFNSIQALPLNDWTMVTIVRDLTNSKLYWYFNDQLVNTIDAVYDHAQISTANLLIGNGYVGYYRGSIDEVILYNKAIDSSIINSLHNGSGGSSITSPIGQMSVSNISIGLRTKGFYAGNVINEIVYTYKGNPTSDTLIHLENMTSASSNYSNILFTQDRKKLSYIILYEGSNVADLILQIPSNKENLIVRINDSYDSEWGCSNLYGNALDFKTNKGIYGRGDIRLLNDSWEMSKDSSFETTLDKETSLDSIHLIVVIRKTSLDYSDILNFRITIGNTDFDLSLNDNEQFIDILGTRVLKENMPWLTNYIKFSIRATNEATYIYIGDSLVHTMGSIARETAKLNITNNVSKAQLKSMYFGPLSYGAAEYENLDNLDKEIIVTGQINGLGNLFMAGIETLDAVGDLYIVADNIYLDNKLYAKTPGFIFEDPVLLGIRDAVTGKEVLYFGSKTEYGIYIFEDQYWRLFESDLRLFSIWRSRHTEGLIVQRKGETSIKIYLFGRDKITNELVYKKDIALTGLPEGEDPYKFEPSMDRRLSQKTVPWTWAKDITLTN